jgi:hypothetical protein
LRQKTIGVLFEGGIPYLLSNLSSIPFLSHHMGLMVAHLRLLQDLGQRFQVREWGAAVWQGGRFRRSGCRSRKQAEQQKQLVRV